MKFEKKFKFDYSGPLLATAQNYVLAAFVSAAVLSAANKPQRLALCAFILRFDKIM